MTVKTSIVFIFSVGLAFSSCKTDQSKKSETETTETNPTAKQTSSHVEKEEEELVDNIRKYITTKYLTEADLRTISEDQRKFQLYSIDLNNDGKGETLVNFNTSYFCGTGGCTLVLLSHQLEPITKFTVTKTPLFVEQTTENGWRTILTKSEKKWRKLIYGDDAYPSNPSVVEPTDDAPSENAQILFEEDNQLETYSF